MRAPSDPPTESSTGTGPAEEAGRRDGTAAICDRSTSEPSRSPTRLWSAEEGRSEGQGEYHGEGGENKEMTGGAGVSLGVKQKDGVPAGSIGEPHCGREQG